MNKLSVMKWMLSGLLVVSSSMVWANDVIDEIVALSPAPEGVVFEVLTHEPSTWPKALSYIKKSIKRLRAKHTDMSFAIVSHGMEEFALLKEAKGKNAAVHKQIQSLVKDDVQVEVCGTFAEWNGHDENDFPDYVTVVDQAPQSVGFYEEDGYEVIVITEAMLKELK